MYNIKILSICLIILFSANASDHGDQKKEHEQTSSIEVPAHLKDYKDLIDSEIQDMNLFGYSKPNIGAIRELMRLGINSILKKCALDLSDKDIDILLIYAISEIDKKINSFLMKNTKRLFDLIRDGSDEAEKILQGTFFHLNTTDHEGFTLLMRAADGHPSDFVKDRNKLEVIVLLLKAGADKKIEHPQAGTALQIAKLACNYEAIELLTQKQY